MDEILNYNSSLVQQSMDMICYGFAIDQRLGKKAREAEFNAEMQSAISSFYGGLKSKKVLKCGPMSMMHYRAPVDGAKHQVEKVVGFPYRIGIVTYTDGNMKHYKMGVVVETAVNI